MSSVVGLMMATNPIVSVSVPTFQSTAIAADPGDGAFTVLYSGPGVDSGNQTLLLNWSFVYQGSNYTKLGISSDSYIIFGTAGTVFTFGGNVFAAANPPHPGIGVCADPTATNDTAYTFAGYRYVDVDTCQIRWKGIYTYRDSVVNRIWDMTFYNGLNTIRLDMYQISSRNSTGTGSYITAKSASAFLANSTPPTDNTALIITC